MSYSKDLQEDKKLVVDTSKNLHVSIKVITEILKGIRLNKEKLLESASDGYSNATELADWSTYCATKAALEMLTKVIAEENHKNLKVF